MAKPAGCPAGLGGGVSCAGVRCPQPVQVRRRGFPPRNRAGGVNRKGEKMSEKVKVEDLRPGDIVRDEERGTGEVVEVAVSADRSLFEVTYSPALGMEDVQFYGRGYELERVSGGKDA